MLLFILSLILLRNWSFVIRSWLAIAVLYMLTLGALVIYGLDGSGLLLAMSITVIVFLMRGPAIGFGMSVLNVLTFLLVGWLMLSGRLALPAVEYQYDSSMLGG